MWRDEPGSDAALIVVHGLGGEPASAYCISAQRAAARAGVSCLSLALRGADLRGFDYYHAGLTDDLRVALATPELARFEKIFVIGYSVGGHMVMKAAAEDLDPRVRAVAAICPPLELGLSSLEIDAPPRWVYRRYVLEPLKAIYAAVARRRTVPTPVEKVQATKTLREWDSLTVVPRYGFRDVDHYYHSMSAARVLRHVRLPALVVAAEADPMVPPNTLRPVLGDVSPRVDVRWTRYGGHVFFQPWLDLGFGPARGLENQVIAWMRRQ